jgi:hypothetical protein
MKRATKPKNKLPLVDYFIESVISGKLPRTVLHKKVLENITSLDDFDQQLEAYDFNAIDFGTKNLKEYQETSTALARLITDERQKLMQYFNVTEEDHYIDAPQKSIVILTEEAFQNMGNNKLNVKENKNEYDLIFG